MSEPPKDEKYEHEEPEASQIFCAADADVVFQSADNVRFSIHRKNLETNAGAFVPSEFKTLDEVVHLTEDARTLDLLFKFMYPQMLPNVDKLRIHILLPLAEAAEKYEVFYATDACVRRLSSGLPSDGSQDDAIKIFEFAGRHDHPGIMGVLAPLLIDTPLPKMLAMLPNLKYFSAWTLYQEHWHTVRQHAVQSRTILHCDYHPTAHYRDLCMLNRRFASLTALKDLEATMSLKVCGIIIPALEDWQAEIEAEIADIPKYTDFLK
ncbi:hypothetical protein C0991_002538 [Blastosporella zonata]|nr:hypothetical protein C0991_002538 [Blastosporella zonata]